MSLNNSKSDVAGDRIFIVDREHMMCELLQYRFENEGYIVDVAHDGRMALQRDLAVYSIILVDLMDCEFTGLQFTRAVKSNTETYHVPVIMVSARASEDDIVNGLDSGADDYMSKPFSTRELVARVRSVIRRHRTTSGRRMSNVMRFRSLEVDLGAGIVKIDDTQIPLTRTEFLILAMLMRHRNQFFERAEILHEAWEDETSTSERTVDTGISRLRKKIGEYGRNIINRQGFGYGFVE
ncbi:MAG: response regulator transcription factor [Paramuribaculum sp.]|nr:response regulator transcription factor [Paramuribaculum sp.]